MSMFDFGFDDLEDSADPSRLSNLVNSYERNGESAYFDSDALEDIATFYFERGRFDDALGVIDRILDNQPYSSDNWMRKGILLNNLGKNAEALNAYQKALSLNPYRSRNDGQHGHHAGRTGKKRRSAGLFQ